MTPNPTQHATDSSINGQTNITVRLRMYLYAYAYVCDITGACKCARVHTCVQVSEVPNSWVIQSQHLYHSVTQPPFPPEVSPPL